MLILDVVDDDQAGENTLWQVARDGNVENLKLLIQRHAPARFSPLERREFVDKKDQVREKERERKKEKERKKERKKEREISSAVV
jgi:hypothetical protein